MTSTQVDAALLARRSRRRQLQWSALWCMRLSRLLVLTCQQAGCRYADVEVGGGTLDVQVKYLGFKVYSSSGDLCEGLPCPLPAGPQTLTFKQQLPKVAPPVRFAGRCLHRRCCYPPC